MGGFHALSGTPLWDRAAATQGDTSKDFGKDEFSSVSVERKIAQPRLRDYPKGASKAP